MLLKGVPDSLLNLLPLTVFGKATISGSTHPGYAEPHLGRLGKSIEIANRAFYLVSDESNLSTISEFVAVLRNLKCHNRTRHYFGGVDFMFKAYKCYWQNAFKYKARST